MALPYRPRRSQSNPPTTSNLETVEPPKRSQTPARLETTTEFDPANYDITIMPPSRVSTMMPPKGTQSAPGTPVFGTFTGQKEAPDDWFVPVTHKEKLAIYTMERIPIILHEEMRTNAENDPTKYFSPTLYPLVERMKFTFSRSMARARLEADSGDWSLEKAQKDAAAVDATANNDTTTTTVERGEEPQGSILPSDVMTSSEVETLFAGIEEVHHPELVDRVVFRRYWRILPSPWAGVASTSAAAAAAAKHDLQRKVKENWALTPKELLAEFAVRADGIALGGRMVFVEDEEEDEE